MARKTLGKMEFADLIESLREQNAGQLAAQQETTKSIRNLTAYFLKSDRADARRRLEEQMEQREAVKVDSSGKPKSGKGMSLGRIPKKGLLGNFLEFLITGALGSKGGSLFTGLFNSLKFSKGFGTKFAKLFGAALLLPDLWKAVSSAFKEDDLQGGITTFIDSFFGGTEGQTFAEKISGGAIKGALLGLVTLGPKGAIVGGLLGGALIGISGALGQEKLDSNKIYEQFKKYFTGGDFAKDIGGPGTGMFVGAMIGGLIGSGVGPQGLIAGAVIGGAIGGIGGMINSIWDNYDEQKGQKSIIKAFVDTLKKHPYVSAALMTGGVGALIGGSLGGPPGIILGALAGAVIGPVLQAIGDFLKSLDIGSFIGDVIDRATKQLQRVKSAGMASLSGDFEEAEKILSGEWATDMKELAKKKKAGMDEIEYMNNLAYLSGVDLSGMTKRLQEIEDMKTRDVGLFKKPFDAFEKLMKAKESEIGEPLVRPEIEDLIKTFSSQQPARGALNRGQIKRSLTERYIDRPREERILRKTINETVTNIEQGIPLVQNERGSQVYTKPTLALVAEKPGTAEYIMSDRNLARLAETIATQRENQTMTSMIPIMMGQGGGGTSMPVINNSYSYQNTENTVREMPTTSSLNMMTALA